MVRYTKGIPIQSPLKPNPNTTWQATTFPWLIAFGDDISANKHFEVALRLVTHRGKTVACLRNYVFVVNHKKIPANGWDFLQKSYK